MATLSLVWHTVLVTPIFNLLMILYKYSGNLGISIIILTIIIRALLIPLVLPSLKNMKKQRDLQPELDKIKQKYKYDKKKQAELQMELFKKHGLNPASGCLSQIWMIVILIALYNVINTFANGVTTKHINDLLYFGFLKLDLKETVNTTFLYLNLAKPDPLYMLAVLSGIFQFFSSKMMIPYVEAGESAALKTKDKKDDIAYNMQEQMLYLMPLMTVIIGLKLPAGAVLYILVTTIFSLVQQYFVSGWGGLTPWIRKIAVYGKKAR